VEQEIREMAKQVLGITDEDFARIGPDRAKILPKALELMNYRFVAEAISSKYCTAGIKVGDKLVFDFAVLNKEESTAPACIGALGPLMESIHIMWDRIAEGVDPNGSIFRTVSCFDPGLEHGGLGNVCFKLTAEKKG